MQAPPQREASPFVAPTRRTIIPHKKQKKGRIEADLGWPNQTIDLALETVKHFFVKNPDIYITKFEQYKDLLTKAKGNPDIVQLAQSYTILHKWPYFANHNSTSACQIDQLKIEFHE